jgi:hypothetical protein
MSNNAFMKQGSEDLLVLAATPVPAAWHSLRDVRRTLECWQTKTFVHLLMAQTGASSVYALEKMMLSGMPNLSFPSQRPKICDRMANRGEPAIAKQLRPVSQKDLRTKRWIDRLLFLAPSAANVIYEPIWRLLDPNPISYTEWHDLGFEHSTLSHVQEIPSHGVWLVDVTASKSESEKGHYIPNVGKNPLLIELEGLLLGLRRWEAQGDLIAYDLFFQELLVTARSANAQRSLAALQPEIGDYIACVFGQLQVPLGADNLQFQAERIEKGRAAWQARQLHKSA